MIKVELEQADLINLIAGIVCPDYDHIAWLEERKLGQYWGGFHDRWEWDRHALSDLNADGLWQIYCHLTGKGIKTIA